MSFAVRRLEENAIAQVVLDHWSYMITALDASGKNALHYAIAGDLDCVIPMICKVGLKERQDAEGSIVLHAAARKGNTTILKAILELEDAHLYINEPNDFGVTPIHFAAIGGSKRCCEVLLSHGAIAHKCQQGFTPFMVAASFGNLSVLRPKLKVTGPFHMATRN